MFLFDQPELLTPDEHSNLGLSRVERPYDFVRQIQAVPVAVTELASVQKQMPIVFSSVENPTLLAVLGIGKRNLFVDDQGQWLPGCYVPAHIRAHPFALARGSGDNLAVVIDRGAASISDRPEIPFFEGGVLSERVRARIDLSSQLRHDQRQTAAFCKRLKELELLTPQQLTLANDAGEAKEDLTSLVAVDVARLKDLDKDELHSLHSAGWLAAVYAHVFSAENWTRLLLRQEQAETSQ
jgi:hypothetical protein